MRKRVFIFFLVLCRWIQNFTSIFSVLTLSYREHFHVTISHDAIRGTESYKKARYLTEKLIIIIELNSEKFWFSFEFKMAECRRLRSVVFLGAFSKLILQIAICIFILLFHQFKAFSDVNQVQWSFLPLWRHFCRNI